MVKGFDCATKLNSSSAKALKAAGFEFVARYLGNSWKTFDKEEAKAIQDAGLKLISIFQKSANNAVYFSEAIGISDAKEAMKFAENVGQPKNTAIYFAVDFDAQSTHMRGILNYLTGVRKALKDYKLGLYGSYAVMQAVKGKVDYYWQTYAWSRGNVADFIHMHQYENDVKVAGITLDRNDIKKEPGHWGEVIALAAKPVSKPANTSKDETYKLAKPTNGYLTAADAKAKKNKKTTVAAGDYFVFNKADGMINVTTKAGVPGSWINPNDNKASASTAASTTKYHTVVKGDTVSALALKYGSTQAQIKAWNNLNSKYLIKIGQKLRVK